MTWFRLGIVCCFLLASTMVSAQQKVQLTRGQWLVDALAAAGCSADWLWRAMYDNGITESGLIGLSAGYQMRIPDGCRNDAPAEVAARSRAILRKYSAAPVRPQREAETEVLPPEPVTDTSQRFIRPPVPQRPEPASRQDAAAPAVILTPTIAAAGLLVVVALVFLSPHVRRVLNRNGKTSESTKHFGLLCAEEFGRNFVHDPGKKIKSRVRLYPHQKGFELWMKAANGQFPSGPSHAASVRTKLVEIVDKHPDQPFRPGKPAYRRGRWIVIPFYELTVLGGDHEHEEDRSL